MALTLLPTLATAEVVPAHNNYKPTIVLDNPGPNVLTGCGEHGRVAPLRLRIPPKQTDGNAWSGENYLVIQAMGQHGYFEFRNKTGASTGWKNFLGNGLAPLTENLKGQHTIEVRVRTGQNIGYGGDLNINLTLEKSTPYLGRPQSSKYRVYSPAIQIRAAGGRGCQTRAQNPTCRGFWDWSKGVPTCLLSN